MRRRMARARCSALARMVVLQHECTRRQVGIGGEHALVDVEHGAGGASHHAMCPDPPATPHRHIRDRYHLVRVPVEMNRHWEDRR